MTESTGQPARARASRTGFLIPLAVFAVLAGLFLYALHSGDPSRLPSALVGKQVPHFALPPVPELTEGGGPVPGFGHADLADGTVTVVNVWASWCIPCHEEHPFLMALKNDHGVRLFGLNYKDGAPAARRFIGRYGNPFEAVGGDVNGRVAIDWGVYGVPETFVVDGSGTIVFKLVGPITAGSLRDQLLPAIARAGPG